MDHLDAVVKKLENAGFPVMRAYAGSRMPQLNRTVVAVSLEKVEFDHRRQTVMAAVLSPASAGGAACEEAAYQVGMLLGELGARCTQRACGFDGRLNAFRVPVSAEFSTEETPEPPEPEESAFTVQIGAAMYPNAVGFTAKFEPDLEGVWGWRFLLEEEFPAGEAEQNPPAEPFKVTVFRAQRTEFFEGCTWTTVYREDTRERLRQIRGGNAKERRVISVL